MIFYVLVIIFLLYFIYCSLLFIFQRQIIFPRFSNEISKGQFENISNLEKIWIENENSKVEAWFLKAKNKNKDKDKDKDKPISIIFAHGNAELIDEWIDDFLFFAQRGYNVLLVEFPGYGRSSGSPSEKSILEIFKKAYDYLALQDEVDSEKIVFMGRSLGGGIVCNLAKERKSIALVLMSTFTSLGVLAKNFFVPSFLVLDKFNNLNLVKKYNNPILIIHGKDDKTIPFKHAQRLLKYSAKGKLISYDNYGHNDTPPDWEEFFYEVDSFLR